MNWISAFKEEDEFTFVFGLFPIKIKSIIIMETATNYNTMVKVLSVFDQMITGSRVYSRLCSEEIIYLKRFLSYMIGDSSDNIDICDFI